MQLTENVWQHAAASFSGVWSKIDKEAFSSATQLQKFTCCVYEYCVFENNI